MACSCLFHIDNVSGLLKEDQVCHLSFSHPAPLHPRVREKTRERGWKLAGFPTFFYSVIKILLCLWEKVNGHSIHYLDFGGRGDTFGINNVPVTKANIDTVCCECGCECEYFIYPRILEYPYRS